MGLVDIREANMQKGIKLLWETDIRSGVFGMVDSEMWQKKKKIPPPSENFIHFFNIYPRG